MRLISILVFAIAFVGCAAKKPTQPLTVPPIQAFVVKTGQQNSLQMAYTGGVSPIRFYVIGQLPPGMSLNQNTGVVSGVCTEKGTFNFSIQYKDATMP